MLNYRLTVALMMIIKTTNITYCEKFHMHIQVPVLQSWKDIAEFLLKVILCMQQILGEAEGRLAGLNITICRVWRKSFIISGGII